MTYRLSDLLSGSSLSGSTAFGRESSSPSETFSAEQQLAQLLGVSSLHSLSPRGLSHFVKFRFLPCAKPPIPGIESWAQTG